MKTGIQNVTMYPPSPFAFFAEMNLTTGSKNDAKFTEKHFAKKLKKSKLRENHKLRLLIAQKTCEILCLESSALEVLLCYKYSLVLSREHRMFRSPYK